MSSSVTLTAERLREVLHYDPETGVFTWLVRAAHRIQIGDKAGSPSHGYNTIRIDGKLYRAPRLAWLYVHGVWPAKGVDHRHGKKAGDGIKNLREADQSQNGQNRHAARSDSTSKLIGALKNRNKWQSRIKVEGRPIHIGVFDTPEEAHAAYVAAKIKFHPFNTLGVA